MKRLVVCMVVCAVVLCGCSSGLPAAGGQTQTTGEESTQNEPTTSPNEQLLQSLSSSFPVIDGSTATIPLSEAIAQTVLGLSEAEAQEYINHKKTHQAYVNLLEGKCDIIFVTPPSDEELAMQDEYGIQMEVVPVVKDGFVFLTNVQNPVTDISLSDLRDVYRGKITNWKELGGEDLAIIPYQRQDNSGSQTLMYQLVVGKDEIMQAPTSMKIMDMGGLVDAISTYDNARGAIGYSVYYYARSMYTSDESHLIAIDGVLPTDGTIASGQYPLESAYYAVIRADEPEGSPARQLLQWLLTDEGQKVAQTAGYVPLRVLN